MTDAPYGVMRGVITSRDVLTHLPTIWRGFGTRCVLRCLLAVLTRRRTTFLQLVAGDARGCA